MRDRSGVEEVAGETKKAQELIERRRQMQGLLVLAVFCILFAVMRAGLARIFPMGWWRLW